MGILFKEVFISAVESIREQMQQDNKHAASIAEIFNTDGINTYDNSKLVKTAISLLQVQFPRDKEGFCEIEHYCFDMNFGKIGNDILVTPEDLWDRLHNEKEAIVSTHPLIDDQK